LVLDDSRKNESVIQEIENVKKKENLNIFIISYRWIDYCLETKYIIKDPLEKKLVNLLPINNVTPFNNFDKFYMYYDDN